MAMTVAPRHSSDRPERQRDFGVAAPRAGHSVRHTRFVGLMRHLLPALAVGLLALVVAWPHFLPEERVQVGYGKPSVGDVDGYTLTMSNPRYYGLDKDERPFTVVADTARQTSPQALTLDQPRADIQTRDGAGILLDAREGVYRQKEQLLDLTGGVNLYHDAGYELHTQAAHVDLKAGSAEGRHPISGHGPTVRLEAEGFRLLERGATIHLTGKSHVVLYPSERTAR